MQLISGTEWKTQFKTNKRQIQEFFAMQHIGSAKQKWQFTTSVKYNLI